MNELLANFSSQPHGNAIWVWVRMRIILGLGGGAVAG